MTESPQKITVSHSEVESFLKCERAHFYGYGLEIQRRQVSDALFRGVVGHHAIELAYKALQNGADLETAKNIAVTQVVLESSDRAEIMAELILAFSSFFAAYPFHGWNILAVEQEYMLPISDELAMPFVVDLIIQDPLGDVWLIDSKFVYNFYTDRDTELLPQLPKYLIGLTAAGVSIDKTAYAMFRYRQQKDQHPDKYFMLKPVVLEKARLRRTIEEQIVAADRIQTVKKQTLEQWSGSALRVANNMICGKCSFRTLCSAELSDQQPQLILDTDYEPRTRREFVVIEDD